MAQVTVSKYSILNLTELLEYEGVLFWDQVDYPEVPLADDDTYIQLTQSQAHRIDLIAYDFYGQSELMWAIMLANNIDYPNQLVEGAVIRIPSITTIDSLLAQTGKQF